MRRIVAGTLAVLLAVALYATVPAEAADWRPAPPDRLAALDEAMAPLLAEHRAAFDAIVADFTVLGGFPQFTSIDQAAADVQARLAAVERLPGDIAYAMGLAHDALGVLDVHPVDQCAADYGAVLRAGWLAYGDSLDLLEVGDLAAASLHVGPALFLLGAYGDIVHMQAEKDCA